MPQDGSNNYQYPPGTPGIPDTTIESEGYNTFLDDLVVNDLNIPRPIHRGGTAGTTATEALINLGGEKAQQIVTNYDMMVWLSGSFYSAAGATAAPVDGHRFVGFVSVQDTNNIVVEAYDLDSTPAGDPWLRIKKDGAWLNSGAWGSGYVKKTGDTMSGNLNFDRTTEIVVGMVGTKSSKNRWAIIPGVDAETGTGNAGSNFQINRYQDDGAYLGTALKIDRATGLGTVAGNPTAALGIATKTFTENLVSGVLTSVNANLALKVDKAGDVMTGNLTLPVGGGGTDAVRLDHVLSITDNKVTKTGDTMSGNLTIANSTPVVTLNRNDNVGLAAIAGQRSGVNRWLVLPGSNPDSGANTGSDFQINRYNDAGAYAGTPFTITRADGTVTIPGILDVSTLGIKSGTTPNRIRFAGAPTNLYFDIDNAGLWPSIWTDNLAPRTLSGNGYQKLQSGLIIQWGQDPGGPADRWVYFPVAFPTACVGVQTQMIGLSPTQTYIAQLYDSSTQVVPTGFVLYPRYITTAGQFQAGQACYWFALGF